MFLLILGLLMFVGLVVAHEWGHFIAARQSGVEVEEFAIGFPPRIYSKEMKSGFTLSINLLPLGGFVKLKGENDSATEKGTYGAASLANKTKIMLAGILMNFGIAIALFTVLALFGIPKLFDNQFTVSSDAKIVQEIKDKNSVIIGRVVENSPASKAGLISGDQLLQIGNEKIDDPQKVSPATKSQAGQNSKVVYSREGKVLETSVKLNSTDSGDGYLGVAVRSGASGIELNRYTWSAPGVAVGLTGQLSVETYKAVGKALGNLFQGNASQASEQVSGPVGIFAVLKAGTELGINFVLMIVAIISLTLALMNLLPIPALDGGRLFVTWLFRAIKKPLTKSVEEKIHGTGFAALMVLFVLITIVDIRRFW